MEGYFAFHHWLLVFIERYPQLLEWINQRIGGFIKDPEKRIKKVTNSTFSLSFPIVTTRHFVGRSFAGRVHPSSGSDGQILLG
jgi:hypothetical protein